ncbi:hypothetical protein DB30_03709 [Enhygromyxa salina]|uniref:DUF2332 domain-containing protein n=1 Tax=Enhygromyxa salina TaxID=215803 RepID=A0A0C2DBE8_9BACT|nr:DUF2332 family protein [Enhygromyxa salina]KIG17112.1 hypothetical protein DB30_03709 [Enhygromyxa salina]
MLKDPAWERHRSSLAAQAGFVRSYSPVTAALLEQAVTWLADPEGRGRELGDPNAVREICERLVALLTEDDIEGVDTGWIDDLQPALRLNAALHWYVLRDDPRVAELRPYFATVAEGQGPDARKPTDDEFPQRLLNAVSALGAELFERTRTWQVVANETSRGIAWLLPAVLLSAEAVHLVELGCSAGLNLYAEQRRYDLAWTASKRLRLGRSEDDEFLTVCGGEQPVLEEFTAAELRGPEVLSRVGGDTRRGELDGAEFDGRLEACIWGNQRRRLDLLRQGMAIHRRAIEQAVAQSLGASTGAKTLLPAKILPVELPSDVSEFLAKAVPTHPEVPVIAYNTCVTAYFSDVDQRAYARDMRSFARSWSLRHKLPWMWVRFEPARAGKDAPHPGWCLWVVELFSGSKHKSIELGWAHPHLIRAEFGPGLSELRDLRDRR